MRAAEEDNGGVSAEHVSSEGLQSAEASDVPLDLAATKIEPTEILEVLTPGEADGTLPVSLTIRGMVLHQRYKLGETDAADVWLYSSGDSRPTYATVKHSKNNKLDMLHHQVKVMRQIEKRCGGVRGQLSELSLTDLDAEEEVLEQQHRLVVLPYVDGTPLDSVIESTGALPLKQSMHIAAKMAGRLAVMHQAGIAHRDIKPQNTIIVTPRKDHPRPKGDVEFIDHSLSDVNGADQDDTFKNGGTPLYWAPELWGQNQRDIELELGGDVYALGHVMYELNTGEPLLLRGTTSPEMYDLHAQCVEGKFNNRIRNLHPSLREVVMLSFLPHHRRPRIQSLLHIIREECRRLDLDFDQPLIDEPFDVAPPDPVPANKVAEYLAAYRRTARPADPLHLQATAVAVMNAQPQAN